MADWGPSIETIARTIVALAVAGYVVGWFFGRAIHTPSASLGRAWASLIAPPVVEVITPEAGLLGPQQGPVPRPLTNIAEELEVLTGAQLRELAGTRSSRVHKAALIALAITG